MTEEGKKEGQGLTIRWDGQDWERIGLVAQQMSRDQHLDLGPTDVIRSAVRRLCEEKLGPAVAA